MLKRNVQELDNEAAISDRQPLWLVALWTLSGLLLNWRCVFEWSGGDTVFSFPVLRKTALVSVAFGVASLLVARLMRWKARDAGALFALASLVAYGHLHLWRIIHH